MFLELTRPYDSHLHLLGIGQKEFIYNLSQKSVDDLLLFPLVTHRGPFMMGFGFQLDDLQIQEMISRIDISYPKTPVFFSRWDGHASVINSEAAQLLNLDPISQVLSEKDHFQALQQLPPFSPSQLEKILQQALTTLNQQGFTHFRDMTSSEPEFKTWKNIFEKQAPTAHIQFYFQLGELFQLAEKLDLLKKLKDSQTSYLKINGLKVFVDGTLGSGTADTKCLCRFQESKWSAKSLQEVIQKTWEAGFEIAFHCIGEQAVEKVVDAARKTLLEGVTGHLHIEHAELMSQSIIQKLKGLHCTVHIQPSHAIDDLKIIEDHKKMGDILVFPIEQLIQAKVPVFLGSDAPIVSSSFKKSATGLNLLLSKKNRSNIHNYLKLHQHPSSLTPFSQVTLGEDFIPVKLVFEDQIIFDHTTK